MSPDGKFNLAYRKKPFKICIIDNPSFDKQCISETRLIPFSYETCRFFLMKNLAALYYPLTRLKFRVLILNFRNFNGFEFGCNNVTFLS